MDSCSFQMPSHHVRRLPYPTASPPPVFVAMCCPRACREKCLRFLLQLPLNTPRFWILGCFLSSQLSVFPVSAATDMLCTETFSWPRQQAPCSNCRMPKLRRLPLSDKSFCKDQPKGEKCRWVSHAARGRTPCLILGSKAVMLLKST